MATYLCVKMGNNQTKSYSVKSSANKPYMRVSTGYLPLTTQAATDAGIRVKSGSNVYRIVESYTTTQSVETTRSSQYDTSSTNTYTYETSRSSQYQTYSTNTVTYITTRSSWYLTSSTFTIDSSSETLSSAEWAQMLPIQSVYLPVQYNDSISNSVSYTISASVSRSGANRTQTVSVSLTKTHSAKLNLNNPATTSMPCIYKSKYGAYNYTTYTYTTVAITMGAQPIGYYTGTQISQNLYFDHEEEYPYTQSTSFTSSTTPISKSTVANYAINWIYANLDGYNLWINGTTFGRSKTSGTMEYGFNGILSQSLGDKTISGQRVQVTYYTRATISNTSMLQREMSFSSNRISSTQIGFGNIKNGSTLVTSTAGPLYNMIGIYTMTYNSTSAGWGEYSQEIQKSSESQYNTQSTSTSYWNTTRQSDYTTNDKTSTSNYTSSRSSTYTSEQTITVDG